MTFYFNRGLFRAVFLSLLVFQLSGCFSSQAPPTSRALAVGDKILDFSLLDENGQVFKFSGLESGWYLVIFLYKGSFCNACQKMLFDLKDNYSAFAPVHATLVAISTDTQQDSQDFNAQWRFPFPLLSDPALKIIDAFGARHVNGHGIYDIAYPTLIIIDPQKTIRYKKMGQNPDELPNPHEIISIVQNLQNSREVQTP